MGKYKSTAQKKREKRDHCQQVEARELMFLSAANDPRFYSILENVLNTDVQYAAAFYVLQHHWIGGVGLNPLHTVNLFNALLAWAYHPDIWKTLPLAFRNAADRRKERQSDYQQERRDLLNEASLNLSAFDKDAFLVSIPICSMKQLAKPYPILHKYVAENADIVQHNRKFVMDRNLPDYRIPRKYMFDAHSTNLSYDVSEHESIIFQDEKGPFLVVIRNACQRSDVVDFIDEVITEVVNKRTNIQKEDPGHLSQMGLSAGSRSGGVLDWVRNVARQKQNIADHCKTNCRASSAFAVFWNLIKVVMPNYVVNDIKDFMTQIGNDIRMDGNSMMKVDDAGRGEYTISINENDYTFRNAQSDLAPPAGVMGENYCHYIHKEKQPHKWAVSLTTCRTFDSTFSSEEAGGHFYVTSHGIRVRAAANTIIAWQPNLWHGTSLFLIDPSNKAAEYYQRGLCFVTSNRLFNAIQKYKAGDLSYEAVELIAIAPEETKTTEESKELDEFITTLRQSARIAAMKKEKRSTRWLQ